MDKPTANMNGVCAAIVTYNVGPEIHRCFDSVEGQVQEVLLVDNGSGPATTDELKGLELQGRASVIYNGKNLGIAGALNQGARYAIERGYRWLLSLDHDSEATPGMVDKLLDAHRRLGPNTAIVAAYPFDRSVQLFCGYPEAARHNHNFVEAKMALSSGSLVDVSIFDRVGFFNESLFLYWVDTDFCLRARKAGLKIYLRRDAILFHAEGQKRWKRFLWHRVIHDGYNADARYYIARNAVFMLRNYYRDDPYYCYGMMKSKLLQDSVKIMLYDTDRFLKMRSILQGLSDGLRGKYGAKGLSR